MGEDHVPNTFLISLLQLSEGFGPDRVHRLPIRDFSPSVLGIVKIDLDRRLKLFVLRPVARLFLKHVVGNTPSNHLADQ